MTSDKTRRRTTRPRKVGQDYAYHFRLSPDDPNRPHEKKAHEILERLLGQDANGNHVKDVRTVIVPALYALEGLDIPTADTSSQLRDLAEMLGGSVEELRILIDHLRDLGFEQVGKPKQKPATPKRAVPADIMRNLTRNFTSDADEITYEDIDE